MEYIIVIDVGTSSLRSMLYDIKGKAVHKSQREYHSIFGNNKHVEQEPSSWKKALIETLSDTGLFLQSNNIKVSSISVTSQRASVIPVNKEGEPLYNALMWQDKRSIDQCNEVLKTLTLEEIYRKTGLRLDPYFSAPKMMWLRDERPEIYNEAYKLIGVQDFVIHLLTGNFITDCTQASRTMLMNINTLDWDEELINITGIDKTKLCELCKPGSKAGGLKSEMSRLTGLEEGIPVIIAGGDQQSAALALNILKPGHAEANTGTGSFVIAFSEKPTFDQNCRTLCSAAAVPGKWIAEAGIFNTGSIYRWFKEEFYQGDFNGMEPLEVLNKDAECSPIGSNGVILLPHFEGSAAPYWNPLAKGMIFNLSLGTKRRDISRAILEGISMEIADNLALIEKISGEIKMVSVAGGLVNFDLFNQIQADAFNKPVVRYANNEATSLGALMSAAVSLGIYRSYEEAFENIVDGDSMITVPIDENVPKYSELIKRKNSLYNGINDNKVYDIFKAAL